MAESAFGVEHGEVSKAFGSAFKMPKMGVKNAATSVKQTAGQTKTGAKQFAGGARQGMRGVAGPQTSAAGGAGLRFGGGLRQNRKAIGYGAGGGTAAGVGFGMNERRRKNGQM